MKKSNLIAINAIAVILLAITFAIVWMIEYQCGPGGCDSLGLIFVPVTFPAIIMIFVAVIVDIVVSIRLLFQKLLHRK